MIAVPTDGANVQFRGSKINKTPQTNLNIVIYNFYVFSVLKHNTNLIKKG